MQSIQKKPVSSTGSIQPSINQPSPRASRSAFQQGVADIAKVIVLEKDIDVFGDEHIIEHVTQSTQYLSSWLKSDIGTGYTNSLRNRVLTLHQIEGAFLGSNNIAGKLSESEQRQRCEQAMALANSKVATIESQENLNRAFGVNLIYCGFNTKHSKGYKLDKPQLGTTGASGGHGAAGSFFGIPSPKSIQNSIHFSDKLRHAAKLEYQKVQESQGSVRALFDTEQILHRGKLLLASADPSQLRANPDQTSRLIGLLVHLDHHVMKAQGIGHLDQRMVSDIYSLIEEIETTRPVAS